MIKIVGDINFTDGFFDTGFGIGSSIEKGADPFQHFGRKEDEVWFGNCECVISDTSDKQGVKKKQFIISPSKLEHIEHFDFYNVANNHVMQHGEEAYRQMLHYFESKGIEYVGSKSRKSLIIEHQNRNVGIVAFSQREEKFTKNPLYWYNPEYLDIQTELANMSDADYKIAYVHWGNEYINRPYADQKRFGRWLIDIGFDLVVGLHPHILQGYEVYKGKHIFYSIGNFVFNQPLESTRYGVILSLNLKKEEPEVTYEYVYLGKDNFPKIVTVEDVPQNYRFDTLNGRVALENENELYYQEVFRKLKTFRKARYISILRSFGRLSFKDGMGIIGDYFKRRLK